MKPVGIIANPASGKDIRRLVALGSVFDNHEKVNIVKRVILGLEAMGVQEVFFMPDYFGIGKRAMDGLDVSLRTQILDMKMKGTQEDSTLAAEILRKMDVCCMITLGGDGTNRAVAKTCGEVALLPISTGTNNVFPIMVEGTLAGLAAGVLARYPSRIGESTTRAPLLEILNHSRVLDIALVDVIVSSSSFIASRAIWDISTIKEIFLSRAEPGQIGFSSVGGHLCALEPDSKKGLHIRTGPGRQKVKAPIGPGLIRSVSVESHRVFEAGQEIPVSHTPAVIAVDGERELLIRKGENLLIRLNPEGPRVIDIKQTLRQASQMSLFLE